MKRHPEMHISGWFALKSGSTVYDGKNTASISLKMEEPKIKAEDNMQAFIKQPERIPLILKLGIWFSEKITGRTMLPARILAWYPKAAIGSGVMEALVAHEDGQNPAYA